jgi:hypothetical protein
VAEASERRVTFLTVAGHPLAGAVRFLFDYHGPDVRFEIQIYDRAANVVDFVAMHAVAASQRPRDAPSSQLAAVQGFPASSASRKITSIGRA